MAQLQNLPSKESVKSTWTVRSLFPFQAVSNAVLKSFLNVYDVVLGFSILIAGISELFGRRVFWPFYIVILALIVASFMERRYYVAPAPKPKEVKTS